jgi:diguanylate cyclase (GGDEF)-like protein
MDLILWIHYTIVRLIVILGVVFLDYLIYLSMKEATFFKTKNVLRSFAWICLMIISLVILQGVSILSEDLIEDRYTAIIQNMDLQLIVLYYFIYMIKWKLMVYFNTIVSFVITLYYIYHGEYTTISNYVISISAIVLIYISCLTVVRYKEHLQRSTCLYFFTTVFYSLAWGIKMLPAVDFKIIGYLYFLLNFVVLMLLVRSINKLVRMQLTKFENLTLEANTDFLTGVGNRLSFDREFSRHFALTGSKENLVFAMIDIDYFKRINDTYGHGVGDTVIKNVAQIIRETLFRYQLESQVFRIGGEEFGILFWEKSQQDIVEIVEAISKKVSDSTLFHNGNEVQVTVSIGVSRCQSTDTNKEDLYTRADNYLYNAKTHGRDTIFMEGEILEIT